MPRRRARPSIAAALAILVLLASGMPAAAADDITPPVGTMELWNMDNETQLAELHLSFSDPESGIDHVLVVCDSGPDFDIPYTTKLFWPIHDGTGGCSTEYGEHWIMVQVYNGAGLFHDAVFANVSNGPAMGVTVSSAPTTGHAITITPVLPGDFTIPTGGICRWEFRWGTTEALDKTFSGDTFGGLLFDVSAASGGCGPWTFTLPWVPYRQFDVRVELGEPISGGFAFGPGAEARFTAAVDSTERLILTSNLPVAQVLPNTYTPIVGQPITYTRYLIGGATVCCNARWVARLGDGENPVQWTRSGGATFTFTPTGPGDLFVGWDRQASNDLLLAGYYDPPVRYRDLTAPVATAPTQRIRPMAAGDVVPIAIAWGGTDRGWGIASYQLQKSVNGGAWDGVALPNARSTSVGVAGVPGTTLRFRVRAKDRAGNVGGWAYGPAFRVLRVSDAASSILWTRGAWTLAPDTTALGGWLHETSTKPAAMSLTFSGRDVAWIAERGPDHGLAMVWLDGHYIGSIDLFSASPEARRIVFTRHWASVGTHTLRIANVATESRAIVDVDGIAILR